MKAVFFDGKNLTLHNNYPKPEGVSLVKVNLAGICGTDLEILDGYMEYSGVLGHEFVGTVVSSKNSEIIGKRVVGEINAGCEKCDFCKKGIQRHCPNRSVLGILKHDGTFAEYLSLPEKNLHLIPDSITDEQAVFVEPLAAAFEIREQLVLNPNWNVAIVGDGKLAQLISKVLKLSCSNVVCFGRHENKLSNLKKVNITTKIGISSIDEQSFDLVVDATGSSSGFGDTMKLVRPRGKVILKSTIASRGNLDLTPTIVNEITVIGSRCGIFKPAIDALATGMISIDDMIDSTFAIDQIDKAIKRAREPHIMKVFLKP